MLIGTAYAQGAPAPGGMDFFISIFPLLLIFGIMYFLLIRPQQQRAKAHREMVAALRKGDIVVTAGGMIGKIRSVSDSDDEVTIELAKGVEVKVIRSSIADIRAKTESLRDAKAADAKKEASKEPSEKS